MLTAKHVMATGAERVIADVREVCSDPCDGVSLTLADGALRRLEEPGTIFLMNEEGRTVSKHVVAKRRSK